MVQEIIKEWHWFMRMLLTSLQQIPNHRGRVYRGVPCLDSAKTRQNYRVGDTVRWNAFSACSIQFSTAYDMSIKLAMYTSGTNLVMCRGPGEGLKSCVA